MKYLSHGVKQSGPSPTAQGPPVTLPRPPRSDSRPLSIRPLPFLLQSIRSAAVPPPISSPHLFPFFLHHLHACAEKGTALLSNSQVQPSRTCSKLSNLSFAQPCTENRHNCPMECHQHSTVATASYFVNSALSQ